MASVSQVRDLHIRCVPLHRFTTQDVCDHINQWVRNDINHKTHLSKTKQIFDNLKLSGQQMIDMKLTDRIKRIVRSDLLPFITEDTLNRMFKCYDQWKGTCNLLMMRSHPKTRKKWLIFPFIFH
eukprot:1008574_1